MSLGAAAMSMAGSDPRAEQLSTAAQKHYEAGEYAKAAEAYRGAMQLAQLTLPRLADEVLFILARAALPLGLLAVGAALTANGLLERLRPVAFACAGKLVLFPLLIAGTAMLFGVSGPSLTAAILWGVLPTSPAAYVLARQLGGDAEAMAAAVTATTVAAFATMPVMLDLLL